MADHSERPDAAEPDLPASSDITGGGQHEFLPPVAPPTSPPSGPPPPPPAAPPPAATPPPYVAAPPPGPFPPGPPPPGPPPPPGVPPPPGAPPPAWGTHAPSPAEYGGNPLMFAGPGGTYELSGWWRRVGATAIDWVVVVLAAAAIVGALAGIGSVGGRTGTIVGVTVGAVLAVVGMFLYAPILMARTNGQTVGKMAAGIRVIRVDGQPMDFGWAALREIAVKGFGVSLASSIAGIAVFLDYLWPLWDAQHQAVHDMICKTRVVRS